MGDDRCWAVPTNGKSLINCRKIGLRARQLGNSIGLGRIHDFHYHLVVDGFALRCQCQQFLDNVGVGRRGEQRRRLLRKVVRLFHIDLAVDH